MNDYTWDQEEKDYAVNIRRARFIKSGILILLLITACWFLSGYAMASEVIPEEKAILAIIGEAENQGYEGMLAVSCAIRNRGSLKGVYGLNAPRVRHGLYTKGTWLLARKAWRRSSWGESIVGQSNAWENTTAFGKPYWASSCEETVTIKDHVFFRCPHV